MDEAQNVVAAVVQAFQQVPAGMLGAALAAGDLGQAGQHAVPESAHQWGRDLVWDSGQALGAGQVCLMDQRAQRVSDLAGTPGRLSKDRYSPQARGRDDARLRQPRGCEPNR